LQKNIISCSSCFLLEEEKKILNKMASSNTFIKGRFKVLEKCGKGSQAQVFKVIDLEDNTM
jgi:hypothetical protein